MIIVLAEATGIEQASETQKQKRSFRTNNHGNDLILHKRISLLATLDGRDIKIPITDVVNPGQEEVMSNEGKEPGKRGNLRIKFDIKFPSRLSTEQKYDLRRVMGGS